MGIIGKDLDVFLGIAEVLKPFLFGLYTQPKPMIEDSPEVKDVEILKDGKTTTAYLVNYRFAFKTPKEREAYLQLDRDRKVLMDNIFSLVEKHYNKNGTTKQSSS